MEKKKSVNPAMARAEKDPRSAENLQNSAQLKEGYRKPSVREKLQRYQAETNKAKNYERNHTRGKNDYNKTNMPRAKSKKKGKER